MLPGAQRSAFLETFRDRALSTSLFSVSLGMQQPASAFGVRAYSTFLYPEWMRALRDMRDCVPLLGTAPGGRVPIMVLVDYSVVDSGLNPRPPYLCSLTGVDQLANWSNLSPAEYRARREQWMDALIAAVDREFPGFAAAIVQREMSTALTMHRELNAPDGAVYGFAAPVPPRGIPRVPSARTPVPGLWLASAYVFSGGFSGAMMGGAEAARLALKEASSPAASGPMHKVLPP
jgi:phytoene dehydrogenase-like protein